MDEAKKQNWDMALCTLYMELISIYEDNNVIDIYYIKLTCIVIQQTL